MKTRDRFNTNYECVKNYKESECSKELMHLWRRKDGKNYISWYLLKTEISWDFLLILSLSISNIFFHYYPQCLIQKLPILPIEFWIIFSYIIFRNFLVFSSWHPCLFEVHFMIYYMWNKQASARMNPFSWCK